MGRAGLNSKKERKIRSMTSSHKSQSEKLAAGGGRETAAMEPHTNKVPGPHHYRVVVLLGMGLLSRHTGASIIHTIVILLLAKRYNYW